MKREYANNNAEYTALCKVIARNLKRAIVNKGMTVTEFSERLGIGNSLFYRYARGEAIPTLYTAIKYCKELGITLNDLVSEK